MTTTRPTIAKVQDQPLSSPQNREKNWWNFTRIHETASSSHSQRNTN